MDGGRRGEVEGSRPRYEVSKVRGRGEVVVGWVGEMY